MMTGVSITKEDGTSFKIRYLVSQSKNLYGVSAEMLDDKTVIAREEVECLWEKKEDAVNCINVLASNSVTPINLVEILDEFFF